MSIHILCGLNIINFGINNFVMSINSKVVHKILFDEVKDYPHYKMKQVLSTNYLYGWYGKLHNYNIPWNKETFGILKQVIDLKMNGTLDVEYEYTDEEYENLMSMTKFTKFQNS